MTGRDDLWATYRRALVDLFPPDRPALRLCPGEVATAGGVLPEGLTEPVFVLTAWNPGSEPLEPEVNRARQVALLSELTARCCTLWPAVGWDPASAYREDGVLVSGLAEGEAVELGRRYGQEALYGWTRKAWSIISCVDDRRVELAWTLEEPSHPVARPLPF